MERGEAQGASPGDGSTAKSEPAGIPELTRAALESWRARMNEAAGGGRSPTTIARMATARAVAELRRLKSQNQAEWGAGDAAEYLRRAGAAVDRAAHEIERNRYSLQAMHAELDRLEVIFRRVMGIEEEPKQTGADTAAGSGDAGGGTNDGGADR